MKLNPNHFPLHPTPSPADPVLPFRPVLRAPRQPEACRRNRASAQEGKGRSARNALTFGLDFSVILLENEHPADFARLEATCKGHWNTTTPAEADLVVDIVNAPLASPPLL